MPGTVILTQHIMERTMSKRNKVGNREKKAERMARRSENKSHYCWLVNERTGQKKLVTQIYGFKMSQGIIDPFFHERKKPWKDTYVVVDI